MLFLIKLIARSNGHAPQLARLPTNLEKTRPWHMSVTQNFTRRQRLRQRLSRIKNLHCLHGWLRNFRLNNGAGALAHRTPLAYPSVLTDALRNPAQRVNERT